MADGEREKIYHLKVMHQTTLRGTFLGLKIHSLEQTSFLTARTVQISQKQGCLSDLSKANVNLFCHPHSGFSLAKAPKGNRISAHHFLSLILQPYRHQSQGGSVTLSRCASDKAGMGGWGGGGGWHKRYLHKQTQHAHRDTHHALADSQKYPTRGNFPPRATSFLSLLLQSFLSDRCPRSCPSASLGVAACLSNDNKLCPSYPLFRLYSQIKAGGQWDPRCLL